MNKLWLIIQREYLTRVKKRSFILATILTPLAIALLFVVVGFIFSYQSDEAKQIVVIDKGNIMGNAIKDQNNLYFVFSTKHIDTLRNNFDPKVNSGILLIPEIKEMATKKHTIYYYSDEQLSLDTELAIKERIESKIRDYKITALNLDKKELASLDTKITVDPEPIKDTDEDASTMTSIIASGIGTAMGLIMYMTVFIYGMMVMRSVKEEKTSRIVEVMISSVRPFELMMGKIIGVGAVGLTQVAIWAILIPVVVIIAKLFFGFDVDSQMEMANAAQIDMEDMQLKMALVFEELGNINWWVIMPLFVFYFLGGYFLYASLFAAVGSAMEEDTGESQALTIPISIPVILALYIMIVVVRVPQSNLAIWSSIFPLFSPIVMPARLAFEPPIWQILLSMVTLIGTSILFVWLSARIYRIGILLYGKKVTLKEMGKWIFYKD